MDPGQLYTFDEGVAAGLADERPVLVHLLQGYVDAGQVARQLCEVLEENLEHEVLAEFDHDVLHDYRSRRPHMVFDTNTWVSLTDYRLVLSRYTDEAGRPFLLLSGPEPDTQWNRACRAVLDIAHRVGVSQLITATGVPMGVPHTRPVLVTGHATDPTLVPDNPVWIDRVQVPGSFGAMLEFRAGEDGLLGRGFVAHVPHYLAAGTYVPGALAVLEKFREVTGLALPSGDLSSMSLATLAQLQEEVGSDAELAPLVQALEQQYDDLKASGRPSVPSADEIGAVVERFLAEQDPDEENGGGAAR